MLGLELGSGLVDIGYAHVFAAMRERQYGQLFGVLLMSLLTVRKPHGTCVMPHRRRV